MQPVSASSFGQAISPVIANIVNPLIELAFGVALVVFIFGVVKLIASGDVSDEARSRARWTVIGGVIGMFIMLSAWGIIHLVANTVTSFK
ncbi:MAG: hypothetical protein KGJ33_03065 [Patescibacteria group bacterium]|nr:hypothetical protein [Patescibacteria group bacterium]